MHPSPIVTHCLAELARKHRTDDPAFDQQGFARIATPNGLTYEVFLPARAQEMVVFILIGQVPEEKRADLLLDALRANLYQHSNGGSVLAFHEQHTMLTVQQRWQLDQLDVTPFKQAMEAMKQVADLWLCKLQDARRPNEDVPRPVDADPMIRPFQLA